MSDNKLILRFDKIKSEQSLRAVLVHNLRLQDTPNADSAKKRLNQVIGGGIDNVMSSFDKLIPASVRKNAVLAHECLVTASPDALKAMTREQQIAFFNDAIKWLSKLHGGKNRLISAAVHYDETTPHLHCLFVPLDANNKLNSRMIIGGSRSRLSELQTEFANEVGLKHGLERGQKNSKVRHTTLKAHAAMINEQLPELERQVCALKLEIERKTDLVRELDEKLEQCSLPFRKALKGYYEAAATSQHLADWQRVQRSYENMPKIAQDAFKDSLEESKRFDDEQIRPFRLGR